MNEEIPIPNDPLSPDEISRFARLNEREVASIDDVVLSCTLPRWRKVAMVACRAKEKLEAQYPEFSHTFYAERMRMLVEQGRLESQGDLSYMRFGEVRLPQ